jgi:hypothetical protein
MEASSLRSGTGITMSAGLRQCTSIMLSSYAELCGAGPCRRHAAAPGPPVPARPAWHSAWHGLPADRRAAVLATTRTAARHPGTENQRSRSAFDASPF